MGNTRAAKTAGPNEKIVNSVIAKYLEIREKSKPQPTRGAGPDFIFNGEIVETKGSVFDFDRAVKQMLDYAPKYRALAFAFPVEALTAHRVMQLDALAGIISKKHGRTLKLICVVTDSQPNMYTVGEHYVGSLALNVIQTIENLPVWTFPETEAKTKNYEANMIRDIDILVRSALMKLTRQATEKQSIFLNYHSTS